MRRQRVVLGQREFNCVRSELIKLELQLDVFVESCDLLALLIDHLGRTVDTFRFAPGDRAVRKSVLEAIESGDWAFEPNHSNLGDFAATDAEPGSSEKLEILARRIQMGLPLWHPDDRHAEDGVWLERLRSRLIEGGVEEVARV